MNERKLPLYAPLLVSLGWLVGCGSSEPPEVEAPFGKFEGRVVAEWDDDGRSSL